VACNSFEIGYNNGKSAVQKNSVQLSPNSKKVSTYFKFANTGNIVVKLTAKSLDEAPSTIEIAVGKEKRKIKIVSKEYETIHLGLFNIAQSGYKSVDFISTTGNVDIEGVLLGGALPTNGDIYC